MTKVKMHIKKIINLGLGYLNLVLIGKTALNLRPSGIIDLRFSDYEFTPLDIKKFKSSTLVYFVINIPSEKIRDSKLLQAWVKTLKLYEEEVELSLLCSRRPSYLFLKNFYNTYTPKNIAELQEIDNNSILNLKQKQYFALHPLYAVNPWENIKPKQAYYGAINAISREFKAHSGKKYSIKDGCKFFGPSSERMIEIEYKRLTNIYDSIKKSGYLDLVDKSNPLDSFPRATLFVEGGEYTTQLEGAWHRTAAMLALDFKKIPVRVSNNKSDLFVKEEVKFWPNVISGLYDENLALKLFDKSTIDIKI